MLEIRSCKINCSPTIPKYMLPSFPFHTGYKQYVGVVTCVWMHVIFKRLKVLPKMFVEIGFSVRV